jgi:tryptophanyl-tRNA synthetase
MTNNDALEAELQAGEEKARAVAGQTIARIRDKLGFS